MTWYVTARGWLWTMAAVVVVVPAAGMVGSTTVPVPDLLSGLDFPLPLSVILPAVPAWLVLWSCTRGEPNQERTAVRFPGGYDLAAVITLVVAQLVAAVALTTWIPLHESSAVVRNTVGYVAVGLIVRTWAIPVVANLVVAVVPVFCASFGTGAPPFRTASWWAWPLQPADSPSAWIIVAVLALAAMATVCAERLGVLARGRAGTPRATVRRFRGTAAE